MNCARNSINLSAIERKKLISDVDDWLAAAARRPIQSPTKRTNTGVSVFQYVTPADQHIELRSTSTQGLRTPSHPKNLQRHPKAAPNATARGRERADYL